MKLMLELSVGTVVILFLLKKICFRLIMNKMDVRDYTAALRLTDSLPARISINAKQRASLRLEILLLMSNVQAVQKQAEKLLSISAKNGKTAILQKCFAHALIQEDEEAASFYIAQMEDTSIKHMMQMQYDILLKSSTSYIQELETKLADMQTESSLSDRLLAGSLEYLLGKSYSYLNNNAKADLFLQQSKLHMQS